MATGANIQRTDRPKSAPAGSRAIAGVRVSAVGERDADTATSAPDQRKWAAAECERRAWTIVGTAEDLSVPGDASHWTERTGLWAGVEAIERGEADVLLFHNTKRLARDVELGFHVKRRVEAAGGYLVLGDCPDGAPAAMVGLMFGQGADDHEEKKAYLAVARQRALDRGDYLAKRAPFGYLRNAEAGHYADASLAPRAIVPGPSAPFVAEAFRMRAAGASSAEISAYLEKMTGARYDAGYIEPMIRNRAYLGERVYSGRVTIGTHSAIVTEEEWMAAQNKSATATGRQRRIKRTGTKSLLSGIARCASCGRKLAFDGSGHSPTYRCPRDRREVKCEAPASIKVSALDDFVWSAAVEWANASGEADKPLDAGLDDQLAAARANVRAAEEDLSQWAVISAGLDAGVQAGGLQARQERLDAARERAADLEDASAASGARVTFRELVAGGGAGVAAPLDVAERRQLLDGIIQRIDVERGVRFQAIPVAERARIFWKED